MTNPVQKTPTVYQFLTEISETLGGIKQFVRASQDQIDACTSTEITPEMITSSRAEIDRMLTVADKVKAQAQTWEKELIDAACKDVQETIGRALKDLPVQKLEQSNALAKQVQSVKKDFAQLANRVGASTSDIETLRMRVVTLISQVPTKAKVELYQMERNLSALKTAPVENVLGMLLRRGSLTSPRLQNEFRELLGEAPKPIQDHIYKMIWKLHGEPKGSETFGQDNLFKDLNHLKIAILSTPGIRQDDLCEALQTCLQEKDKEMSRRILDLFPASLQGKVYGAIYERSRDPEKAKDTNYGKNHALDNCATLDAIIGNLLEEMRVNEIPVFTDDSISIHEHKRGRASKRESKRRDSEDEIFEVNTDHFRPSSYSSSGYSSSGRAMPPNLKDELDARLAALNAKPTRYDVLRSIESDICGTLSAVTDMTDAERSAQVNAILEGHPEIAGQIYGKVWEKAGKPDVPDFGKNNVGHDVDRLREVFGELLHAD